MPEESDPPRKFYGLKPKEFERVNMVEPGSPPPAANDVFAIQRELREREIAAGLDELKPADRPRSNRRKRDYWIATITITAVFGGVAWMMRDSVVVLVYAGSGLILANLGLIWTMWFVIDDY